MLPQPDRKDTRFLQHCIALSRPLPPTCQR